MVHSSIYIFTNTECVDVEEYTIPRSQIYWPLYVCFLCLKTIIHQFVYVCTLNLRSHDCDCLKWATVTGRRWRAGIIYSILKSAFKVLNFDVLTDP